MYRGQTLIHFVFSCCIVAIVVACSPDSERIATHSHPTGDAASNSTGILSGPAIRAAPLLRSTDPGAQRFLPVGKLLTGTGSYNCTATLIAGSDVPAPARRALVLTAGHCAEETDDNAVIVDRAAGAAWSFTPAYFIDTQPQHRTFGVARILYATMKGVDLAVLELNATYGDLAALGIHPLALSADAVTPGTSIELVHIPVTGVPQGEQFLRHSSCRTEALRFLVEGTHPWWWRAALPNDCEGVAGGTSGSPVFQEGSNVIVAILNTTVTPGLVGCGPGRPCELGDDNLISPREGASYAIPVNSIARALRPDGTLDIMRLDDGHGVDLTRLSSNWISQSTELVGGNRVPARWNLRVGGTFELIRYKVGPAAQTSCADSAGYGAPVPLASQPLEQLALPAQEGIYAACVIGGNGGGIWQPPADATMRLRQLDDTGPSVKPQLATREAEGGLEVRPEYVPWELVFIYVKHGSATETDCHEMSGYRIHINNRWYAVDNASEPWRFCAYGNDMADNAGPVATFDFPPEVKTTDSASAR